jgi:hypothetical protein
MEMEYTVELTVYAENPLTEDQLVGVAEIGGAAGGDVGKHRLSTTLTIDAESIGAAINLAAKKVKALVPGHVARAEGALPEEHDRRVQEEKARSELVGITEIAAYLELSKQRAFTLSKREDFPEPVQRLASGAIWRKADLSTFAEGWQRKAGRPRKERSEEAAA